MIKAVVAVEQFVQSAIKSTLEKTENFHASVASNCSLRLQCCSLFHESPHPDSASPSAEEELLTASTYSLLYRSL